ncbi:MAG: SRPBCC family protein [Deltaproteobacteria bacterium]|nr:SRPBCC family protein [Deltaproteobacteria bacterium]
MPRLEFRLDLPGVPQDVIAAVHADPRVLEWLSPPEKRVRVIERPERIVEGARIVIEVAGFGVPIRWVSRIEEWEPPVRFVDVQVKGPFARWRHEHLFEDGALVDRVDYEVPLSLAGGRLLDLAVVRPDLRRMFRFRHAATAQRLLGKR